MKSLKFADLKDTKTAVNCRTNKEAKQVEKICGFKDFAKKWSYYKENFCISFASIGTWGGLLFYKSKGYEIISASDFIVANTKTSERKVESIQRYTFEIVHYNNGESVMHRKNEGFSVIEMIGISEIMKSNVLGVFKEAVKPPTETIIESTESPIIHKPKNRQ